VLRVDFNESQRSKTNLRCILKLKFTPNTLLVEAAKNKTKITLKNDQDFNLNLKLEFECLRDYVNSHEDDIINDYVKSHEDDLG